MNKESLKQGTLTTILQSDEWLNEKNGKVSSLFHWNNATENERGSCELLSTWTESAWSGDFTKYWKISCGQEIAAKEWEWIAKMHGLKVCLITKMDWIKRVLWKNQKIRDRAMSTMNEGPKEKEKEIVLWSTLWRWASYLNRCSVLLHIIREFFSELHLFEVMIAFSDSE